jgi:hypothetical protein
MQYEYDRLFTNLQEYNLENELGRDTPSFNLQTDSPVKKFEEIEKIVV